MSEFLYIHIPFCARKCIYCDFLSIPFEEPLVSDYVDALCRELELKKGSATGLRSIFLGGGTPSILKEDALAKIFSCLHDNYTIRPDAEITIEANPGTLTEKKARFMASAGINRCSIGVQSFVDSELMTLGRIHTAEEAIRSAEMIRTEGIENLSIDLIYGIPGQTIETWQKSLDTAVSLKPKHISAYELTPERGTGLQRLLDSGSLGLQEEDSILSMYDLAVKKLADAGFEHYEISNYALPGHRCIHNLNYWDRGEYIGVGAGAHSFNRGFRSKNTEDITGYIMRLKEHIIPEAESTEISREDTLREFVFLGLRKIEGIRLSDADELGLNIMDASSELIKEGFAEITGGHFRLTEKGLPVSNTVIVRLLLNLGL